MPSATLVSSAGVYPRVCGGTASGCHAKIVARGLSPRVRGNPIGISYAAAERRSIPACAGEPASTMVLAVSPRVYPRVCGGTSTALAANG